MSARPDFCAVVLSHGRPSQVLTVRELRRAGYTGTILVVVDDEDATREKYAAVFGGREDRGDVVVTFVKRDVEVDVGDNDPGRRGVVFARNAAPALVRAAGFRFFCVFDDDYFAFFYRWNASRSYVSQRVWRTMDACLNALVDFLEAAPPQVLAVAMSQGGDHIGGGGGGRDIVAKRKAMNSFVCSVDRPFRYAGRMNDDVNTYVVESLRGGVFLTISPIQLIQVVSQAQPGGLSEMYADLGTYTKSFYSVMYAPACVKISELSDPAARTPHRRIHHEVDWSRTAPLILREEHRRTT